MSEKSDTRPDYWGVTIGLNRDSIGPLHTVALYDGGNELSDSQHKCGELVLRSSSIEAMAAIGDRWRITAERIR